jgi:hypothetical protein
MPESRLDLLACLCWLARRRGAKITVTGWRANVARERLARDARTSHILALTRARRCNGLGGQ